MISAAKRLLLSAMKNSLLRVLASVMLLCGLCSCVGMPMDAYSDPGPTAGGGYYDGGSYGSSSYGTGAYSAYSPSYSPRPYSGSLSTGYGWGGGYGGGYAVGCAVCRQRVCCCAANRGRVASRHDHDDDHCEVPPRRSSSSSSNSSDSKWRYSGSVRGGDSKPVGNHSREWYKERGYDVSKLRKVR
jgi:hypothetical protein